MQEQAATSSVLVYHILQPDSALLDHIPVE